VPLLPASLTEPLGVQFSTLLKDDDRPEFVADHPWGCHRRRIPDRVVFDHVLAALVHGSGYERIATPGCSDRTIRRRLAASTHSEQRRLTTSNRLTPLRHRRTRSPRHPLRSLTGTVRGPRVCEVRTLSRRADPRATDAWGSSPPVRCCTPDRCAGGQLGDAGRRGEMQSCQARRGFTSGCSEPGGDAGCGGTDVGPAFGVLVSDADGHPGRCSRLRTICVRRGQSWHRVSRKPCPQRFPLTGGSAARPRGQRPIRQVRQWRRRARQSGDLQPSTVREQAWLKA